MNQEEKTKAHIMKTLNDPFEVSLMRKHALALARKLDAVLAIMERENTHPYKPNSFGEPDCARTPNIAIVHDEIRAIIEAAP